jgi:von Willebrand factor type A domain
MKHNNKESKMKYINTAHRVSDQVKEVTYILIDFSGSMYSDDYEPTRKEGAIQANMRLIETKAQLHPNDQMGIIAFEGNAHLIHHPVTVGTGSLSLCQSLRKEIKDYGGTNFTAALKHATSCFFGGKVKDQSPGMLSQFLNNLFLEPSNTDPTHTPIKPVNDKVTRRIIMLTDGEHTGSCNPVSVAQRLKTAGVIIECIGIAGTRNNVDEKLLKQIASIDESGDPRYYFIKDTADLIKKYQTMAHHIRPV